ncbi:hypothetical protein LN040_16660 [Desulfovibrio subterraneus]|nr:hypothetical protein [Desulfovibrio subterraneus]WBF67319.1 hypothetical protein LN040_16660 [Desulfovibrio subterraneus]
MFLPVLSLASGWFGAGECAFRLVCGYGPSRVWQIAVWGFVLHSVIA